MMQATKFRLLCRDQTVNAFLARAHKRNLPRVQVVSNTILILVIV